MRKMMKALLLLGGIALCFPFQLRPSVVNAQAGAPDHPIYLPLVVGSGSPPAPSGGSDAAQRINIPHFSGAVPFEQTAVFWFGQVDPNKNSVDVRMGYNDQELYVYITVIDRRMWYTTSPSASNLTAFDSTSLYLSLDGVQGTVPSNRSYRFDSQLSWFEGRAAYQAAARGNGSNWASAAVNFSTQPGYRGTINQDSDGKGWVMNYHIPFASLGLSGPPPAGTHWALGVVVHDRDSKAGTPLADESWPTAFNASRPLTWGGLTFGLPTYSPPGASPTGSASIQNKRNNAVVKDAAVGGGANCGAGLDYWQNWGLANYSGPNMTERNVQNQSDVSDYPCFSKSYFSFPLGQVPAGKVILSATLSLHQMGNSDPTGAKPSLIQVSLVNSNWNPGTINWNNAPQAIENVSQAWVDKLDSFPGWPGVQRDWDVTRAVAMAYAAGQPLSIALYSADSDYHSGKYFVSSDTGDWNSAARPVLTVTWGQ